MIAKPAVRNWLTNTRRTQVGPIQRSQALAVPPSLLDVMGGAIAKTKTWKQP
jgi:hypothetical protein